MESSRRAADLEPRVDSMESGSEARRRTVLFLMVDTGAGHRSAANAVASAMRLASQANERDCDAVIVDGIKECGRLPFRKWVFLYGPVTRYCPRVFGAFFHATDTDESAESSHRLCASMLRDGLRQLLERVRPDVIVSTHHFFGGVVPQVLRECGVRVPFITVITDLVTIHRVWLAPEVDAWVAPSEYARQFLLAGGIDDARILCSGLPIDPRFSTEPQEPIEQRRAALGLDPALPVVLLVGGGEGVGGLARVARALEREEIGAQLVIVTGRNQMLRRRLLRRRGAFRTPVRVLGFAHNMPELMRAADVLVTKGGSLTLSEALACALPVVLMGALPGQEEGNVGFVQKHGIGVYAPTPVQVVAQLRHLLAPGSDLLARMRANARELRRPGSAREAAALVFSYLPPAGVPSVWERLECGEPADVGSFGRCNRTFTLRHIPPDHIRPRLAARRIRRACERGQKREPALRGRPYV